MNRRNKLVFNGLSLAVLSALVLLPAAAVSADADSPRKGPNVSVTSSDLEPFSLNKKTEPEQRPTFYSDDKTNIDINENGEPNLNMRF